MARTHEKINKSHDMNQSKTDVTSQNKCTTLFSLLNRENSKEETKQLC